MNKKTLYLFFIILICLVFLSGCKNDSSNTSEENVSANKVNTEASINNIMRLVLVHMKLMKSQKLNLHLFLQNLAEEIPLEVTIFLSQVPLLTRQL